MMRPRGKPPTPSARSSENDPVGMTDTFDVRHLAELHDRAFAEFILE